MYVIRVNTNGSHRMLNEKGNKSAIRKRKYSGVNYGSKFLTGKSSYFLH